MEPAHLSVLLIEDDMGDATLIREIIASEGWPLDAVRHVSTMAEAIPLLQLQRYDVILLDLGLGPTRGLETLHQALSVTHPIPIVILTEVRDADLGQRAVEMGAQDYLVKGEVTGELLLRALRYAVGRAEAIRALEASELRSRALLDSIPDTVLEVDSSHHVVGLGGGRSDLILGPREESRGRHLTEVVHPEVARHIAVGVDDLLGGRLGHALQHVALGQPDSRHFEIRLATSAPDRVVAVIRDVTESQRAEWERQRLETRLRQVQRMEALGNLARGIAHDFNNVLAAILGYSEIALGQLEPGSPAAANVERALDAAEQARDLVDRLLTFAREARLSQEPVNLSELVEEIAADLRKTLPPQIELHIEPGERETVFGDRARLRELVQTLCMNARRSMETTGGRLGVTLERTSVDPSLGRSDLGLAPGEYLVLSVSDTGPDIDPELLDRIFEPYYAAEKLGGVGLSFSTLHGIANRHGGTIVAESLEGGGTAFRVYLPAARGHDRARGASSTQDLPRGVEHVLFVDDDETLGLMAEQMLSALGYRVTRETSSLGALELLQSRPGDYDLVVADQTMPYMPGLDFLEAVRGLRPDIPLVLAVSFSSEVPLGRAQAIGLDATLLKPYSVRHLGETLRQALDRRANTREREM